MELRKQKEIEYYDRKIAESGSNQNGDFEGFNPFVLESCRFLKEKSLKIISRAKVLDYGCGNGIHTGWLAEFSNRVTAVDLSENSLEAARKRVFAKNIEFVKGDCEELAFPDNSFDVVFDGGTFSSLDLGRAFSEIARVLRPGGILIGIETFGHNPFTNLKRFVNKFTGKRTEWAAGHILKSTDLKSAKKYFDEVETGYFHIVSWFAIPFLRFPFGTYLLGFMEKLDHLILAVFPFLRRYSFKIVFILQKIGRGPS